MSLYSVFVAGSLTEEIQTQTKMFQEFQTFVTETVNHPIFIAFALCIGLLIVCTALNEKYGVKCTS